MAQSVLLTGATGFVGSHILHSLLQAGYRVSAVCRPGREGALPAGVTVLVCEDVFAAPTDWWQQACTGHDAVIHAAWYVEPQDYLYSPRNLDCLQGTLTLARAAQAAGVRRFIGIGTCFEYDVRYGMLSTTTPLLPQTPYASAKAAAYLVLSSFFAASECDFVWARLFYLHGAGEKPARLVPYLHSRLAAGLPVALSSGRQIRDYLAVDVAGERIAALVRSAQQGAVNICSGEPVTIRQLATDIAASYGRSDLLCFGTRPDNPFDPPCVVGQP